MNNLKTLIFVFIFFCSATFASESLVLTNPTEMINWGTPKTLSSGAHDFVLQGNPSQSGVYTVRLKLPAHYKIMPYIQTKASYITVIQGSYYIGNGTTFNKKLGKKLTAQGFAIIPANTPIYAWTEEETIIQIHGEGPIEVLNASK